MLTDGDLTAMRADVAALLPDTCAILTATTTTDDQGGVVATWGTAAADVACRLDYVRGVKILVGGAIQPFTGWMFTLPWDATVTPTNRIAHNGQTYSVVGEDSAKSWKVSTRVAVER